MTESVTNFSFNAIGPSIRIYKDADHQNVNNNKQFAEAKYAKVLISSIILVFWYFQGFRHLQFVPWNAEFNQKCNQKCRYTRSNWAHTFIIFVVSRKAVSYSDDDGDRSDI